MSDDNDYCGSSASDLDFDEGSEKENKDVVEADFSEWVAYVKYKSPPHEKESVKVCLIKEVVWHGKEKVLLDWNPKHLNDFRKDKMYSCLTKMNSLDGRLSRWEGRISCMKESQSAMAKHLSEPSTRTVFFPFDVMDTNEMSTDVEGAKIPPTKSQSKSLGVKRVKKSKLRQTTNTIL
ncbi:ATP-dependent RNA helicase dbp7 [Frankliniella fusca]|uniref:ATP-dependent RNA helicase dbp7 n=1 Tax=Frankliniella fusca TaxID=407009 RepID=A0AAE1LVQ5_9NEOP|nr:ATP-dependent RNA helicase dbp7 [Frankliniella fusca]